MLYLFIVPFRAVIYNETYLCCDMIESNGTHVLFYGEGACGPRLNLYLNSFYWTTDRAACTLGGIYPTDTKHVTLDTSDGEQHYCCIYKDNSGNCWRTLGTFAGCGFVDERPPLGMLRGFRLIPCDMYKNVSQCFEGPFCS